MARWSVDLSIRGPYERSTHLERASSAYEPGRSFEPLESRRVLDCFGLSYTVCVPGDSDGNKEFDEHDLVHVFEVGKYSSDTPAFWAEGDWNGDRRFNSGDLVWAFQAGTYLQGVLIDDMSSFISVPSHTVPFGPPLVITNVEQLRSTGSVHPSLWETDFNRQTLLLFSWAGSGQDLLIAEPTIARGEVSIHFRFEYGVQQDLHRHHSLLAIPKEADWNIQIGRRIHDDTSRYEFDADRSHFVRAGGFAGLHEQYTIQGPFTLARNADGSAAFSQVEATLSGTGSLHGARLDSILNLSGLSGLQVGFSSIIFSGFSGSSNLLVSGPVARISVEVNDLSLIVRGGDYPIWADSISHRIDAQSVILL